MMTRGELDALIDDTDWRRGVLPVAALCAIRESDAEQRQVIEQQAEELTRLRKALNDMATDGLRFDLNPTYDLSQPDPFFHGYIRRMDASLRERAAQALKGAMTTDTQDGHTVKQQ